MIPVEAQQTFAALLDALGIPQTPGLQIVLHIDNEAQLGLAEYTTRLRKQKVIAPSTPAAHTQPQRTQQFVGTRSVMR
jgi:hypothetical protein